MRDRQKDDVQLLLRTSAGIGIEEELKSYGVRWDKLTPHWARDFPDMATGYHVVYELTQPDGEREPKSGYYTVEELRQLARANRQKRGGQHGSANMEC